MTLLLKSFLPKPSIALLAFPIEDRTCYGDFDNRDGIVNGQVRDKPPMHHVHKNRATKLFVGSEQNRTTGFQCRIDSSELSAPD